MVHPCSLCPFSRLPVPAALFPPPFLPPPCSRHPFPRLPVHATLFTPPSSRHPVPSALFPVSQFPPPCSASLFPPPCSRHPVHAALFTPPCSRHPVHASLFPPPCSRLPVERSQDRMNSRSHIFSNRSENWHKLRRYYGFSPRATDSWLPKCLNSSALIDRRLLVTAREQRRLRSAKQRN